MTSRHTTSEFGEAYDDEEGGLQQALFDDPLAKIPRRRHATVGLDATVATAVATMNKAKVGCVLIVHEDRLAGIFTERDALTKVLGPGLDPATTPISDVMTSDPTVIPDSASIAFTLHHMSIEGYRHLPLVDNNERPTGVVAMRDIIMWMVELFPASLLNQPPASSRFPTSVDGG